MQTGVSSFEGGSIVSAGGGPFHLQVLEQQIALEKSKLVR